MRGIFDTDGNLFFKKSYLGTEKFKKLHNHYPVITLTTISKFLAEDIIKMLHEMDIVFYYHMHDSKKKNENRVYLVTINGVDELNRWMELVGMENSVKLTRYLVWKKFGFCPPNTTLKEREDILNDNLDIYSIKGS